MLPSTVLPLVGPGLLPLDAGPAAPLASDPSAAPPPDPAAEPEGYLVAMDAGVRIHFLDWGGPARAATQPAGILMIHGLAQTAWSWTPVARRVRAAARAVAMDLRGHGLSDAPASAFDLGVLAEDAIAVAEGAGILALAGESRPVDASVGPLVVAGHGFGAVVGAWVAHELGKRCTGLVLVDGGWTDVPRETGMTPDEWLAAIAEPPAVLRSMAAWLADREGFDAASWDADQDCAARAQVVETAAGKLKPAIHAHALAATVRALWTYDPAAILPAVEAEIVALAARDDDGGRHHEALREVAALRAAAGRSPIRAAAFPGLGHNLMRYAPDAVVRAVRASAGLRGDARTGASG